MIYILLYKEKKNYIKKYLKDELLLFNTQFFIKQT